MATSPVGHVVFRTVVLPEASSPKQEPPTHSEAKRQGWPKFWNLFSFILPGDVKDQVYEPALVHLLKDYDRRVEFSGKWATRWIHFCFVVRTLLLAADCFRCLLAHRAFRFLKELFLGK